MSQSKPICSVCVLAYERPSALEETLSSLIETHEYPLEIIVHDDGSKDPAVKEVLKRYRDSISLILDNCGQNVGVGRAFTRCLHVATGEYVFKCDSDVTFLPGWDKWADDMLSYEIEDRPRVIGFFDYMHYNPEDTRFAQRDDFHIAWRVHDFVNSVWGIKREHLACNVGIPDDGYHTLLRDCGYELFIPKQDFVLNKHFGIGKSVYIDSNGEKTAIYPPKVI